LYGACNEVDVAVMDRADFGSVDDVVGCENVSTEVDVVNSSLSAPRWRTDVDEVSCVVLAEVGVVNCSVAGTVVYDVGCVDVADEVDVVDCAFVGYSRLMT
jgi:hypothetical protein